MKDMTQAATTMMTDEEKAEMEKALNPDAQPPQSAVGHTPPTSTTTETIAKEHPTTPPRTPISANGPGATETPPRTSLMFPAGASPSGSPAPGGSPKTSAADLKERERLREQEKERRRQQKAKLAEQEKERRKAMDARVSMLTAKMVERLRPFVEAEKPGEKGDRETELFEAKMRREADDLKLESFGVEVNHRSSLLSLSLTCRTWFLSALTYHWHGIYDEGILLHEVAEILGNVSTVILSLDIC